MKPTRLLAVVCLVSPQIQTRKVIIDTQRGIALGYRLLWRTPSDDRRAARTAGKEVGRLQRDGTTPASEGMDTFGWSPESRGMFQGQERNLA
jgi:hypothetical protein